MHLVVLVIKTLVLQILVLIMIFLCLIVNWGNTVTMILYGIGILCEISLIALQIKEIKGRT